MFKPLRASAFQLRCRRWAFAAVTLSLLAAQSGCVERRLTVRSNPPGAQLYVDDYEIGTTPVAVDFTYYGTRKIRLVKDGYETAVINQPIPAPWYQYFPADFVTENLVPGHIRDERVVTYQMQPAVQVPPDQLVTRAEALRQNGRIGAAANAQVRVTPPPAATIPPAYSAPPSALPPGMLPAPSELVPSPTPAPLMPQNPYAPPNQFAPQGQYPPPGYAPSPVYVPAPYPSSPQPSR
ncbi:MAG TPA: PEGA domain-containing protein [Pirellulales bacterium]|nr:PEGA domain-containing protein [Pirellulales bacterium]